MRVSNNKAREYVDRAEEFQGSNMFGKWLHDSEESGNNIDLIEKIYVVYSYGSHFPMYIYDKGQDRWIGNTDKYSRSTTRHQSQGRPSDNIAKWYSTEEMLGIVRSRGLLNYMISKAQT